MGVLGKLAMLAMFVVQHNTSTELETVLPTPPPLVSLSLEEDVAAERSARATYQ